MGTRVRPPVAAFLFLALLFASGPRGAQAAEAPAYLALGDSLAFGVGATNPAAEGYVGLTHFELEQSPRYADSGIELVNLSEPGATSSDLLEPDGQLDRALEEITRRAQENPDAEVEIISLDVGGNDLLALAEEDSPCLRDTSGEACLSALGEMLNRLQENVSFTLESLREAAPDARIFLIDLYNPYSGTGDVQEIVANVAVQQVNGVLSAAAADPALDVEFVSIYELFVGRGPQWIASDGIHPNDAGHRAISLALLAALNNRPLVLPPDLAATPGPTEPGGDPAAPPGANDPDNEVSLLLFLIALPLAFLAGGIISAAYFVTRGR